MYASIGSWRVNFGRWRKRRSQITRSASVAFARRSRARMVSFGSTRWALIDVR